MSSSFKSVTINDTGSLTLPAGTTSQRSVAAATVTSFTSTGATTWTCPANVTQVEVLVVAGGGGAGGGLSGGGGAGGVIYRPYYPVVPGTVYTVAVGAGGVAGVYQTTTAGGGGNSQFDTLIATGGGGSGQDGGNGGNGGSGAGSRATPGTGIAGQGNNGATGVQSPYYISGGGGGAGGPGTPGLQNSTTSTGQSGAGGPGIPCSITGSLKYYGGGGGGGCSSSNVIGITPGQGGAGGIGGGGNGANWGLSNTGANGVANTGGGGGGGGYGASTPFYTSGGAGGSGVVILAYTASSTLVQTTGHSRLVTTGVPQIEFSNSASTFLANKVITDNLYWHFDFADPRCYAGTGTTANNLGSASGSATLTNGPTYKATNGGVLNFIYNSTNAQQLVLSSTYNQGAVSGMKFSVSAWIRTNYTATMGIVSNNSSGPVGNGFMIQAGLPTYWYYNTNWGYFQPATHQLNTGEWRHVTWTMGGTNGHIKIYIDGNLEGDSTITTNPASSYAINSIGVGYSPTWAFNGEIAMVSMYEMELTSDQVRHNYNVTRERFPTKQEIPDLGDYVKTELLIDLDFSHPFCYPGYGNTIKSLTGTVQGLALYPNFVKNGNQNYFGFSRSSANQVIIFGNNYSAGTNGTTALTPIPEAQSPREVTMEAWIYVNSVGTDIGAIWSCQNDNRGSGFGMSINTDGRNAHGSGGTAGAYHFQLSVGGVYTTYTSYGDSPSGTVTTGVWVHLAATRDSRGNKVIYQNGELLSVVGVVGTSATTFQGTITFENTWWQLGGEPNEGTYRRFFDGNVAIARIYNKALSPQEVKYNYVNQKNRFGY